MVRDERKSGEKERRDKELIRKERTDGEEELEGDTKKRQREKRRIKVKLKRKKL